MDLSFKLLALCCCISLVTADQCIKKSPCSCMFPNGTGINLIESAGASYYKSDQNVLEILNNTKLLMSTFYYHPCADVRMPRKPEVRENTCDSDFNAVCYHANTWVRGPGGSLRKDEESYHKIGSIRNSQFAPDGSYVKYFNGTKNTIVHLTCAEMDDKLIVEDVSSPNQLELRFLSRNACFYHPPGQSQGTPTICENYSHGPKGELRGVQGLLERKGIQGSSGFPRQKRNAAGVQGATRSNGEKGETGEKGERGYTGFPGVKGERGDAGYSGPPGFPGMKGQRGSAGPVGPAGPPGPPGPPGPCSCS